MGDAVSLMETPTNAQEATIRTMRRGFARVLDHHTLIDILTNGDRMHDEARRERERRKAGAPVGART